MTTADLLAGIPWLTARQLDHWCRRGYLRPENPNPGSGKPRTFTRDEALVLKHMATLVASGVAPAVAEKQARAQLVQRRRATGLGWPEGATCR